MRKIITESASSNILRRVIDVIFGIFTFIIATRFILKLFGANAANGFVNFVYDFSSIFVFPFRGILPDFEVGNIGIFETSSLVALVIIAVIYGLLMMLFSRQRVDYVEN